MNDRQSDKYKMARELGMLSSIPILLAVSPLVGYFIGKTVDGWLGTLVHLRDAPGRVCGRHSRNHSHHPESLSGDPGIQGRSTVRNEASRFHFLKRTVILALATGVIAGWVVASRWGWTEAAGFMAGCLWGLANFAVLGVLLVRLTARQAGSRRTLVGWACLKALVLGGGLTALGFFPVPLLAFSAGFTWPLVVVVLRGAGAMWWARVQDKEAVAPSVGAAPADFRRS